jgi:hypothetical protein
MRWLACLSLVFSAAPVRAADKDEDKAKEVVVAFLKAIKAKDIDALMKTVDVPFYLDGVRRKPVATADDLKAKLRAELDRVKPEEVETEVGKVLDLPAIRKEAGADADAKDSLIPDIEKVIGKDGFVVPVLRDGKERYAVLVRIKDGKAKVVGVPK